MACASLARIAAILFKRSLVRTILLCSGCCSRFSTFFIASTLSIFRPGSTSPSAILYDAWESFSQRSPKADENIRSIRPDLAAAVDECIDAAGHEWEPYWQRRLLNVRYPKLMVSSMLKPLVGSKIRPRFLGLLQSYGLREHGTNPQSP